MNVNRFGILGVSPPSAMVVANKFVSTLLLLTALGCGGWEGPVLADAQQLGDIDLELRGATLGYLKSKLSTLDISSDDCRDSNIHYVDCKVVHWGSGWLVTARFITGEGFLGAKSLDDKKELYDITINDNFRGTLCGENFRKVAESNAACGNSFLNDLHNGSGRRDIVWSRRN